MNNINKFNILRLGFDGLDVSFKSALPEWLLGALEIAKARAQRERQPARLDVCPGLTFMVEETGARGGYAYRCDTGPEGETWFFKRSTAEDWNIRVSCKSAALAIRGWDGTKKRLYSVMNDLDVTALEESVGRVDLAFDFTAPADFRIDPGLVVAHPNMGQSEHSENDCLTMEEVVNRSVHWRNRRVTTLTIGKMPGRQIQIYDKSLEIRANGKEYWWQFWKVKPGTQVYRLEVRAGKAFLKERCNLSSWTDIEERFPAIVESTLCKIRMRDPESTDANISRTGFHPVWMVALEALRNRFAEALARFNPVKVIRAERKRIARIFEQLVTGSVISYANVCVRDEAEWKRFTQALCKRLTEMPQRAPEQFNRKWQKSADKYCNLIGQPDGQEWGHTTAWATA